MSKLGSTKKQMMRHQLSKTQTLLQNALMAQTKERLFQNGITVQDLENAENTGYKNGYEAASWEILKGCYAGIALALEEEGMDRDNVIRVLRVVDNKVCYALGEDELIDEVFRRLEFQITFRDPISRIQET